MTTNSNISVTARSKGFSKIIGDVRKVTNEYRKMINLSQSAGGRPSTIVQRGEEIRSGVASHTRKRQKDRFFPDIAGGVGGEAGKAVKGWGIYGGALGKEPTEEQLSRGQENLSARVAYDASRPLFGGKDKEMKQMEATAKRLTDRGSDMNRMFQQLGDKSKISAAQVSKLRLEIERLILSQQFQKRGTEQQLASLRALDAQLKTLQNQVIQSSSGFQFMAGASQGVQKGIRNLGAAAQGSMLAMSALNGDIMGMAFGLIFLQFAANVPVALGFGAIAVMGALAFKEIQKIIQKRKEVEQFGKSFHVASGNVQGYEVAQQRAVSVLDKYSLSSKDAEQAEKALMQTQLTLMRKGIEPTAQTLDVVAQAFVVASHYGADYENAIKQAQEAGTSFAESGIITFGGFTSSTDKLQQDSARALQGMGAGYGLLGDTIGEMMDAVGADRDVWFAKDLDINELSLEDLKKLEREQPAVYGGMSMSLQAYLTSKTRQLKDDTTVQDTIYDTLRRQDEKYLKDYKENSESILGEIKEQIKEKQELARVTEEAVQRMLEAEKHLAHVESPRESLEEYRAFQDSRSFATMKELDREYMTIGSASAKTLNTTLDYNMEEEWLNDHLNSNVEITINDQTRAGTLIETTMRNSGNIVIGPVGMSSTAGNI